MFLSRARNVADKENKIKIKNCAVNFNLAYFIFEKFLLIYYAMSLSDNNSITVTPVGHCINRFKNNCTNFETRWIGFDKYKKIIYGVRRPASYFSRQLYGYNREIVAKSAFFDVEPIVVRSFLLPWCKIETFAMSDEHIAFFNFYHRVYLFSIEKGTIVEYQMTLSSADRRRKFLEINYSSNVGWVALSFGQNGNEIYRFVFKESTKTCSIVLVTKCPASVTYIGLITVTEKSFYVFDSTCDFADVYNFREKYWMKRYLYTRISVPGKTCIVDLVCSKKDEGHVMISQITKGKFYEFSLYHLLKDCWEPLCVKFNSTKYLLYANNHKIIYSNGILFINADLNEPGLFVNVNVLSLQDITLKQIFDLWNLRNNGGLPLKTFMEDLNLPILMKRQYFGPSWIWENNETVFVD